MKPLTWLSATSRAQMIETSHQGAFPIHFFWPLMIQVSPSRFAVVVSPPPVPEPTSGSVNPKQALFSMRAIGGNHLFFCSSDPPMWMDPIASPLCTPTKVAIEASQCAISLALALHGDPLPPR